MSILEKTSYRLLNAEQKAPLAQQEKVADDRVLEEEVVLYEWIGTVAFFLFVASVLMNFVSKLLAFLAGVGYLALVFFGICCIAYLSDRSRGLSADPKTTNLQTPNGVVATAGGCAVLAFLFRFFYF